LAPPALAGNWTLSPQVSVEEAFNDNVRSSAPGTQEGDFISRVSPGVSLRGTGGRVSLNGDYNPERLIYLDNSDLNEFRQNLLAGGNVELVQGRLFLDAQASVSQQIINPRGAVTGSTLNANSNRSTVQTYNLTPTLRQHFGSWADTEVKARLSRTFGGGNDGSGGQGISNTTITGGTVTVSSGRRLTRAKVDLTLDTTITSQSGVGNTTKSYSATSDLEYRFSSQYALTGTIGLERIKDNSINNQTRGLFWTAGFLIDPSPRTSLKIDYGDRFETKNFGFDLNYDITPRTRLQASFSETVTRSQNQLSNNLATLGVDDAGNLVNLNTGLPFVAGSQTFGVSNNSFHQKRYSLSLVGSRGRNNFSVDAFNENRETDATGGDEKSIGGNVSWSRTLSRFADISLNLGYTNTDFSGIDDRTDDLFTASTAYTYKVSDTLQASFTYSFSDRTSSSTDDLRENVVTFRVSKIF